MHSFSCVYSICSIIIAIHCIDVMVIAFANEHLNILNESQSQPCDRTRRIFTESEGEFSDGPAGFNYTQDSHCEWLIKAKNDSQFITLKFHSLATECSYDYLFVYDGDSMFKSSLIGSFSGKTDPQQVVATSGNMLIVLYSDTNYVLNGFRAEYFISNCPNNCSGKDRGKCVQHTCVCIGDWISADCSVHACPDNCGVDEGRGVCMKEHCRCKNGYSGKSCSLHIDNNVGNEWHYLASSYSGLAPRAAHSAVYVRETDSLYVYGGFDLNNILGALQIYRFNKSTWEDELGISLRSRHFPAEWDNTLLKAILYQNEDEAKLWGLKSDASFFRNILLSISDENFLRRHQRSPKRNTKHSLNLNESISNQDISEFLEALSEKSHIGPMHRYGHAACSVQIEGGGFIIHGGKLENGSLANDLWVFNASAQQPENFWTLRAVNSTLQPPKLTRHTITQVENYLYIFGGSLSNGEFSSRMFRIQLMDNPENDLWEEVYARGGKTLDVRLVAHTTIHHKSDNSLIVYGGVVARFSRFSKLSDRIFAFHLSDRYWTEIHYPRMQLREAFIPRERAFHSSTIIGNYMVVFGGYTHRHNKEEICYDNQMYLYHLKCHVWVNLDVLGLNPKRRYPKNQGVFAHAAAVRNDNTLLIVGGYHGNVNADLLAYTLPSMLQIKKTDKVFDPENHCHKHTAISECLSDLDCGWCSVENICSGRTFGANCTTNLLTGTCPGICPALGSCHACLIHGNGNLATTSDTIMRSFVDKTGLNHCQWCVQNARCHHKADNFGTCGSSDDTPSQEIGFWGANGVEIDSAKQCSQLDRRPGLTFLKYYSPINWTIPDEVSIVNATTLDFLTPAPTTKTEHDIHGDVVVARLHGFIRPPKKWIKNGEQWQLCASYAKALLKIGSDVDNYDNLRIMGNLTASESQCQTINWTDMIHIHEDISLPENAQMMTERLLIDFQANRSLYSSGAFHPNLYHTQSKIRLQHNGTHDSSAFTFEYLETFSKGECENLTNCLECLSDAMCGWCDISSKCFLRTKDEESNCARSIENSYNNNNETSTEWKYFIVESSQCSNCSDHITCENCLKSGICEYWSEDARCSRIGRSRAAVKTLAECPSACNLRTNCTSCLDEEGRCVWCETTSTCFSFSVYTSEYQFGICREWLDQTISLTMDSQERQPRQPRCKTCDSHKSCGECLQHLKCGWCFDRDNPIEGICMQGDFNGSVQNCGAVLHNKTVLHTTKLIPGESEYAYAQCPDVDECGLGLHNCHVHARCINTPESFDCYCRRGFVGDGFTSCVKTCYETCANGYCSGAPEYRCICDLGWTGASCSISCGCNNHSACSKGPGICDECQHWTEGVSCERCRRGSYGNATSIAIGCKPCECNGHGNSASGVCDIRSGECFCQDNTEGMNCEKCSENYYGNPTNNGQCFFQCESRGMLKQIGGVQGIGSYQSHKTNFGPEVRECLWIISPYMSSGSQLADNFIQFEIQTDSSFNVTCTDNAVYVYDGLPDLIGHTQQRHLLGVFCNEETKYYTVEGRSGHLTIHYKQSVEGQGFNAVYTVRSCTAGTCLPPRVCNEQNQCVCLTGFTGVYCEIEKCPQNCSNALNQGKCDIMYGRCLCERGFGGPDCSILLKLNKSLIITELFNSQLISESLDHLRKTLPRFGHSLVSDKRGNLWMFAGYSLHHQALNDIRQFDTRNSSWMQVTVDGSSDAKMPQGRYLHSADIHGTDIFVYGGLTGMSKSTNSSKMVLDDFWKFSIIRQSWAAVDVHGDIRPPPLVGHTLTLIRDQDHDVLLLIGGFSPSNGFNQLVYTFNLTTDKWSVLNASGTSPIGIFGHTAVFHSISKSIYVFGGYAFQPNGKNEISNRLFALNTVSRLWSEIPIFSGINQVGQKLPRARFLHSAISTDNYMLVYGGKTKPKNSSDYLNAYVYSCNMWIRLTENVDIVGELRPSYAQGMVYDSEAIYIVTGWDGSIISRVIQLNLPADLCELFGRSKNLCRSFMGCSFCTVIQYNVNPVSHCFSNGRSDICTESGDRIYNPGILCNASAISKRSCSDFSSCESCTAVWSYYSETNSPCFWCQESLAVGHCLPLNRSDHCGGSLQKIMNNDLCPATRCNGDCGICTNQSNCRWEQSTDTNIGTCLQNDDSRVSYQKKEQICSSHCDSYRNCSGCLSHDCRWSTQLEQCISIQFQPLICGVGGICGLVLQPKEISYCPEPCSIHNSCSKCLRHAHCGWCSKSNNTEGVMLMGDGVCTEGSLESPSEFPAASTCDIIYANQKNLSINPSDEFIWNYVQCPPENECANGHHNCDARSERCIDRLIGYECECADGFETLSDSISRNLITDDIGAEADEKKCIPKCTQGCVRGRCTEPDTCTCDFGYTGLNCSIQCQCNGHADCQGPQDLNVCLECKNNTMGEQCEKCKPLFVGDPRNNGECIACVNFCHGHTDLCVDRTSNASVKNMNRNELLDTLTQGPQSDAVCLRCQNETTNDRCEGCIFGHFRGAEDYRLPCRKCHCQGHGETCHPVLGDGCDCHNNTESDTTCTANRNSAHQCWMTQCSKCRETYTGNPLDGHQCYKQLTVESKMCFDAKTIDECKKPTPLKNGQTVFFVIQPRFMNVDIRIIVDVTQGELNLYLSPQDDALIVENSPDASHHDVYFDGKYHWLSDSESIEPIDVAKEKLTASSSFDGNFSYGYNGRMKSDITHDCSPLNLNSLFVKDVHAKDLSTYVTLNKCNTMLRVYNLKNRLCIQLAHHIHNLSQTRFYIALKAVNGPASYGLIFFRQDQLHIDLFVFFSVFFSCFFLFLAVCVVIWKFKMAANVRQERIRHVNEMLHMAKRPFASIQLSVLNTGTPPRRRALRSTNSKHFLATASHQNIRPIAVEPTADNCSAVCTVFISLPSNGKSSPTVALGSALVAMNSRQFPAYQRIPYIRRRRISSRPGTSNENISDPSTSAHIRQQAPIQLRMQRERRNINLNQVI